MSPPLYRFQNASPNILPCQLGTWCLDSTHCVLITAGWEGMSSNPRRSSSNGSTLGVCGWSLIEKSTMTRSASSGMCSAQHREKYGLSGSRQPSTTRRQRTTLFTRSRHCSVDERVLAHCLAVFHDRRAVPCREERVEVVKYPAVHVLGGRLDGQFAELVSL